VRDLKAAAGPEANVHVIKMGVDPERFRRSRPLPGGRTVLAVGRLIEKKGFRYLLDAAAQLREQGKLDRLVLVGDGPLREPLRDQAARLGLDGVVEWRGARDALGVREALAEADVLAIPAVPASDGDRDVLPLIAGEALAMEVPVVASDFVGLPEVVQRPWGRLVPPGDSSALAGALAEILDLDLPSRAAAGSAGRQFVMRTRDQRAEARRLVELIAEAQITGVR
jgi:glycosyltransferase involved in cell wall biosynthesis